MNSNDFFLNNKKKFDVIILMVIITHHKFMKIVIMHGETLRKMDI